MEFKLGQVDQISKDYEKLKMVKDTEFSIVVLRNMKTLFEVRQEAIKLRELPQTDVFLAYDSAIQVLYEKHVMRNENAEVVMDNGEPRIKDPSQLESDMQKLDLEHVEAKDQLLKYEESVNFGMANNTFSLEDFSMIGLPSCLDAVTLEVLLRYVPK